MNTHVSIKRNRAGRVRAVKDPAWPNINTFSYQFTAITKSIIDQLKIFLERTAGLEINIVDHKSISRDGYIVTAEPEIIRIRDDCSFDVAFDFRES